MAAFVPCITAFAGSALLVPIPVHRCPAEIATEFAYLARTVGNVGMPIAEYISRVRCCRHEIAAHSAMQRIWTAARNDEVHFA